MSILQNSIVPVGTTGGYEIDNSLRFNDDDSAYLSWTPASAGTRTKRTFSAWVKRANQGEQDIFGAGTGSAGFLKFRSDGVLQFGDYTGGYVFQLRSNALYRDPSAWYHIVAVYDTANGTATQRQRLYVNGSEVSYGTQTNTTSVGDINNNVTHWLGHTSNSGSIQYLDGYLSEVHFIDGTALDPTSFGETGDYGEWKAKKVSGLTYGTNGFHLDFKNSGTLGNDANGSNNWTTSNLASTDQMLDTPTNNFCTINPLDVQTAGKLSEGNLQANPGMSRSRGTIGVSSGKWYYEFYLKDQTSSTIDVGIRGVGTKISDNNTDFVRIGHPNSSGVGLNIAGTTTGPFGSVANGVILGVAWDMAAETISFYKNGAAIDSNLTNVDYSSISNKDVLAPHIIVNNGRRGIANFGQDSSFAGNKTAQGNQDGGGIGDFYYTPPSGFLALCTKNLPDPAVIPSEHFNTVTYAGNGGSNTITTGLAPDLIWIKQRNAGDWHHLFDEIRGHNNALFSNDTQAESTKAWGMSLNADSFSTTTSNGAVNGSSSTYVSWNWKANGTGVSNTDGSITSTVSANADAGFSIVSYTGTGSAATIGHGLSSAPEMIIVKPRDGSSNGKWSVYDSTNGNTKRLYLNTTAASATSGGWSNTSPTNTVWTMASYAELTGSGTNFIAYCFHSVDGYSKVGSYTGNGNSDGTFVYTGFRPAYVLIKGSSVAENWNLYDSARTPENDSLDERLKPNSSAAEVTSDMIDFTSNGFKIRTTDGEINTSGATYIFLCFAEHPFKHTNAR